MQWQREGDRQQNTPEFGSNTANVSGAKKRGCILIKRKYFGWTLQRKNAPTSRFKVAFAFWIDISPNEEKKGLEEPRDEPQRLVTPGWNPLTFATHPLSRSGQAACQCAGFQAGPQMKKTTLNFQVLLGGRRGLCLRPHSVHSPGPSVHSTGMQSLSHRFIERSQHLCPSFTSKPLDSQLSSH